jgi:hypothetical protein
MATKAYCEDDPLKKELFKSKEADAVSQGIMQTMVQEAGDDPEALQAMIEEIKRNPASMEKYLNAEQREMMKKVHEDMEKEKAAAKPK